MHPRLAAAKPAEEASRNRQGAFHTRGTFGSGARALRRSGVRRRHVSAHQATLLSYSAIQVRGGWPALPADVKLAPGATGPTSHCCAGISSSPTISHRSRSRAKLRRLRHRRRQAVPVASRARGHRQRRRADAESAERTGRRAHQTTRSLARASARHGFRFRRALRRGEHSGRLRRGGRARQGRAALPRHCRQNRQAVADAHRLHHRGQSQSDLDRAALDHQERDSGPHAPGSELSRAACICACSVPATRRSIRKPSTGRPTVRRISSSARIPAASTRSAI